MSAHRQTSSAIRDCYTNDATQLCNARTELPRYFRP
ncbi:hypothetical protein T03_4181 [Trichinella britovi]|uniref:Uncharacterized protein n=1 Tax=Trichinella britovi TaxID=45882 RepID=A0A0V1AN89_TRIBR|nr:hypothetical protein T03_4181 [Trichinella britovi]